LFIQAHEQQGHGGGFVEIADEGKIVGDQFEDAGAGVEQIEDGQQAQSKDDGFFMGFLHAVAG